MKKTMKMTMWFPLACMVVYAAMQVVSELHYDVQGSARMMAVIGEWIAPIGVLLTILCGNKFSKVGAVLFPVSIGWLMLRALLTSISNVRMVAADPQTTSVWVITAFDAVMLVGMALMIVGSLQGFRRVSLMQVGAFLNAGVTVLYVVVALVGAWTVSYFESVPDGVTAFNWVTFGSFVATALFYAGIGVFGAEKKREKALDFSTQE